MECQQKLVGVRCSSDDESLQFQNWLLQDATGTIQKHFDLWVHCDKEVGFNWTGLQLEAKCVRSTLNLELSSSRSLKSLGSGSVLCEARFDQRQKEPVVVKPRGSPRILQV